MRGPPKSISPQRTHRLYISISNPGLAAAEAKLTHPMNLRPYTHHVVAIDLIVVHAKESRHKAQGQLSWRYMVRLWTRKEIGRATYEDNRDYSESLDGPSLFHALVGSSEGSPSFDDGCLLLLEREKAIKLMMTVRTKCLIVLYWKLRHTRSQVSLADSSRSTISAWRA